MSEPDAGHMDDTRLLKFIDRELDASDATDVDQHLIGCDICRSRLSELQSGLHDLITLHRERKSAVMPPPRPWAELGTELDRLDGGKARKFPTRPWMAIAAAALVAGVFWNFSTEHTVSAAELLDNASRKAPAEPGRRITVKTRRQSFVRPARLTAQMEQGASALAALFDQANFSWEDPLSARSFARWRDHLPDKKDEVTLVDSGGPLYRIRTTTSHGVLSEAVLTMRVTDMRPLEETLRFADDVVEIRETEPVEPGIPRSPGTRIAAEPSSTSAPVRVSAAEELRVLAALNEIGADLGDPIDVARDDEHGVLTVKGVGIAPARQQQIRDAVRDIPGVVIDLTDSHPVETYSAPQAASPDTVASRSPVQDELESRLGAGDRVERFVDLVVAESESALGRAHALRKLATRFPPDVERELAPPEYRLLAELRSRHILRLSSLADSIEKRMSDAFGSLPHPERAACGSTWQECSAAALSASQKLDTTLNSALAGTGSQRAPGVDDLKRTVGEWRQQIVALRLTVNE